MRNSAVWRQQFCGTIENSGHAADDFDFDKDGLVNLVGCALGPDPTQSSAGQLPEGQIVGPDLVFSFTGPAGVRGISYGGQSTTPLQPADFTPVPETGVAPGHILRVPSGTNRRIFMRLNATRP